MSNKSPKYKLAESPDIGKMLHAYFKTNRTYKSGLARALNRKPRTLYALADKPSLQTAILWEISLALKHNFFADIAAALNIDSGFENPLQKRVEELEKEKHDLELKVATLEKVIELMRK